MLRRILNTISVHDFHFTSSFFLFVCLFVCCLLGCFFVLFLFSALSFFCASVYVFECLCSRVGSDGVRRLSFAACHCHIPSKYTLHFQFWFTLFILFVFCVQDTRSFFYACALLPLLLLLAFLPYVYSVHV